MAEDPKYRPDIDGLRALAVLLVIFFHADLGCAGGFVGVDIFFVISGFLITSLILKEIGDDAFDLLTFWERRIRRILPALLVVVCATIAAGWFLYLPEDFDLVGRSVVAQAFLVSNVFFGRLTGYFAPGVDTKPLLHTWSLAVEEQFYVLFPLLLILLARQKRFSIARTILWLGVGSFALSVVGSYTSPSPTFYLLPTRAWELMVGAFLAATPGRKSSNPRLNESLGLSGLGLILYSAFFYTRETRFPGLAAIPPCLGAALIIFAGRAKPTLTGRLLSLRPVVFIGLISYSLYLWHWPLLVFSKYLAKEEQSVALRAALLVTSTALAILSWRYIETPFRRRWFFNTRPQILGFAGISMATLLAAGFFVHRNHGFPSRLPEKAMRYANSRNHRPLETDTSLDQLMAGKFVELGAGRTNQPISLMIWGDSHARSAAPVLDDLCRQFGWRGVQVTHSATAPVLGYIGTGPSSLGEDSPAFATAVLDCIIEKRIKHVVIAANWSGYTASDEFKTGLLSEARSLLGSGTRVYLLRDVPRPGFDVPRFAAITALHKGDLEQLGATREQHQLRNRGLSETFAKMSEMGVMVLDPADYFLNSNGLYGVVWNDQILYYDAHHLTVEGAKRLAPLFKPIFENE